MIWDLMNSPFGRTPRLVEKITFKTCKSSAAEHPLASFSQRFIRYWHPCRFSEDINWMGKEGRERGRERRRNEGERKKGESEERRKERREGVSEFEDWFYTVGSVTLGSLHFLFDSRCIDSSKMPACRESVNGSSTCWAIITGSCLAFWPLSALFIKSKFINVYACRLKSWLVSSDVVMKSLPHKDHHKAEKLLKDDQKTLPAKAELLLLLLSHFSPVWLCATP